MKNKFLLTMLIMLLSADCGFCASAVRTAAIKFGLAMMGVALSSLVIYLGLTIYNKFFVKKNTGEKLISPRSNEEAINFFIKRNRL